MTPEQEEKINVLTLELKRLNARVNDMVNLMYNMEKNIIRKVTHQMSMQKNIEMPRGLNAGSFDVAHGKTNNKAGGKKT